MKKYKVILVAAVAVISFTALAFTVSDHSNLVKVVHKGRVIEVAPEAVSAHLAHGDTFYGGGSSSSAQ